MKSSKEFNTDKLSNIVKQLRNIEFNIIKCKNFKSAYEQIKKNSTTYYNLILLDIQWPVSSSVNMLTEESIGLEIRKFLPNSKIIISINLNDTSELISIIKTIDPDGVLIKSDINSSNLITAVSEVISGKIYYSKTVLNLLRNKICESINNVDDNYSN